MMTYDYAAKKIENIFNHELEHVDRIQKLIEPDPDWVDRTNWIRLMETCIDEYTAAARTVIEIYIELTMGECENWRKHKQLLRPAAVKSKFISSIRRANHI